MGVCAWRLDRGLLVRFLAVGCGLNSRLAAGWGLGDAELLEFAGDFEGNLESLLVVEPWVDVGLVGFTEVRFGQTAGSSDALGDVLAGEFQVGTAEARTAGVVDSKRESQFVDDVVESPGLAPVLCSDGVSVHGVAHPED